MANVTAAEFKLADRDNIYKFMGTGALSSISENSASSTGYKVALEAGKTGGSLQFLYALSVINDTYNQDDLGYLKRNNEITNRFSLSYNFLKPFGIFLGIRNKLDIFHARIYKPGDFSEFTLQYEFSAGFKNHYSLGFLLTWAPFEGHDYYETRTPNRYYVRNRYYQGQMTLTTDQRQTISIEFESYYKDAYAYDFDTRSWLFAVAPTLRFNDRLMMVFDFSCGKDINEAGFIEQQEETGAILFGMRNRDTLINMWTVSYIFNNKISFHFKLRHYWSKADYKGYYELTEDGRLSPSDYNANHDVNYNAFNIDLTLRWNFAPGSEMRLSWKNSIYTSDNRLVAPYWENLRNTLVSPQINSLSFKIVYYFDGLFK